MKEKFFKGFKIAAITVVLLAMCCADSIVDLIPIPHTPIGTAAVLTLLVSGISVFIYLEYGDILKEKRRVKR